MNSPPLSIIIVTMPPAGGYEKSATDQSAFSILFIFYLLHLSDTPRTKYRNNSQDTNCLPPTTINQRFRFFIYFYEYITCGHLLHLSLLHLSGLSPVFFTPDDGRKLAQGPKKKEKRDTGTSCLLVYIHASFFCHGIPFSGKRQLMN